MGAARPERALWQRYRRGFPCQWCRRPGPRGATSDNASELAACRVPDDSSMSVAVATHRQMQNHLVVAYQPVVLPHSAPKQGVSRTVVSSKVSRCGRPETPSCAIAVFLIGCAGPEPWDFPEPATVPSAMCQVELLHPPEAAGIRWSIPLPTKRLYSLILQVGSACSHLQVPLPRTLLPVRVLGLHADGVELPCFVNSRAILRQDNGEPLTPRNSANESQIEPIAASASIHVQTVVPRE